MGEEDKILSAVTALHGELTNGFNRVYDEIGKVEEKVSTFGKDLLSHQLTCSVRFGTLETNTKLMARDLEIKHAGEIKDEQRADKVIADDLRKRVNWGTVKTSLVGLVLGVVLLAALKILLLNHNQIGTMLK